MKKTLTLLLALFLCLALIFPCALAEDAYVPGQRTQALIDAARKEADDKLTAELSRLEALRAVNPNIRDDELAAIESNRQQVMDALAQAGWRLDALRLIVVTHQ